jgi:hypothetical protein
VPCFVQPENPLCIILWFASGNATLQVGEHTSRVHDHVTVAFIHRLRRFHWHSNGSCTAGCRNWRGFSGLTFTQTQSNLGVAYCALHRLEQLTDNLKAPQKASVLFFGPSVSFDTISDARIGSQSLVIWPYKSKLQA